ncbi:hypothetical protein RHOSPDRAFT_31380 [Rhodotorula sp. JG-1b]|nr:hypothetical protein RHOSPDRAFT_31380 [Rhodotorula sp. JG-1b]
MQPVPPPRRSATFPTPAPSYSAVSPRPEPTPAAVASSPAALAHHRSLVEYYWHYAQGGYAAPLTALEGTEERRRQEAARDEAVEWAKRCGIPVVDPLSGAAPAAAAAAAAPAVAAPVLAPSQPPVHPTVPVGGMQCPNMPVVPTRSVGSYPLAQPLAAMPATQAYQRVQGPPILPHSSSSATPLSATDTSAPVVPFSPAPNRPLPTPRGAPLPPTRASTASSSSRSRPLPRPPPPPAPLPVIAIAPSPDESDPAELAKELAEVRLANGPRQNSETPTIPIVLIASECASPPAPTIPTFSFSTDHDADENDDGEPSPAVPTFSFGLVEDDDGDHPVDSSSASRPSVYSPPSPAPRSVSRRAPPLHPRFDPSHPSHRLYHPTSVMSPLSAPTQDPHHADHHHARPEAGTIACSECDQLVFGRVLFALGKNWHPDCFRCAEEGCGAKLEVMEFEGTPEDWEGGGDGEEGGEELRGKAWCMVHFEERFALECHHCHTPIASADYLPIADPALPPAPTYRHSSIRYYHPLHFFCAGCGDPFIDPVQYESARAAPPPLAAAAAKHDDAPDLEAKPYFAHDSHPYCDRCDLRIWRPKCPGCRKGLREEDGFLELPEEEGGGKWHEGCFKCSLCEKALTDVYMIRRMNLDPDGDAEVSSKRLAEQDEEDQNEVAVAFCLECFDRTE